MNLRQSYLDKTSVTDIKKEVDYRKRESKAATTHEVEKASGEKEENGLKERENLESDVVEERHRQRKALPLECSTQILPPQRLSLQPLQEASLLSNHVPFWIPAMKVFKLRFFVLGFASWELGEVCVRNFGLKLQFLFQRWEERVEEECVFIWYGLVAFGGLNLIIRSLKWEEWNYKCSVFGCIVVGPTSSPTWLLLPAGIWLFLFLIFIYNFYYFSNLNLYETFGKKFKIMKSIP